MKTMKANILKIDLLRTFSQYEKFTINKNTIPQEKLDLTHRNRRSLLPWRGQFSPDLIELILEKFAKKDDFILDPFLGSGTTMFESARKSLNCYGAEINPSAIIIAKTIQFVNLNLKERARVLEEVRKILDKYDIPSTDFDSSDDIKSVLENLRIIIKECSSNDLIYNAIANIIMRFMEKSKKKKSLNQCFLEYKKIVEKLPYSKKIFKVMHSDARSLPIEDKSVDLIVTSPPYINVFNYHQNFRPSMELIGWDVLRIAKSEFGSNRKHRGNRFLTVIQYSLDMLQALKEMRRVIKDNGRLVIIIGRESSVRGVKFDNGKIISTLATCGANFKLELKQERKFKTKFGKLIYENILNFIPDEGAKFDDEHFARVMSQLLLKGGLKNTDGEIHSNIKEAILESSKIQPSQFLQVTKN